MARYGRGAIRGGLVSNAAPRNNTSTRYDIRLVRGQVVEYRTREEWLKATSLLYRMRISPVAFCSPLSLFFSLQDIGQHLVDPCDETHRAFWFEEGKPKFGWPVTEATIFEEPTSIGAQIEAGVLDSVERQFRSLYKMHWKLVRTTASPGDEGENTRPAAL